MRVEALLLAGVLAGPVAAVRGDTVQRRGTEPALTGTIVTVNDAGVSIRSETGAEHFVAWDRVRDVQGGDPGESRLAPLLARATDLWRARSRVERHDTMLAEPLLERLWGHYRGQTNETALVVAEGLLRCRLARGDQTAALLPALEVTRLRRQGRQTTGYGMLRPVLDPQLELCPMLAPVWLPSRGLARLAHDLAQYDAGGDREVAAMARLYRLAVLRRQGLEEPAETAAALADLPDHRGVKLLEAAVQCASPDAPARAAARRWLIDTAGHRPDWAASWSRYCAGVSLLRERGVSRHQEGLLSLSYLPARHGRTQPWLAGMALAHMIRGLAELGDAEGADSLASELTRLYAGHPVVAMVRSGADASVLPPPFDQRVKEPSPEDSP